MLRFPHELSFFGAAFFPLRVHVFLALKSIPLALARVFSVRQHPVLFLIGVLQLRLSRVVQVLQLLRTTASKIKKRSFISTCSNMEINKQEEEASLAEFMKVSLEGFSWAENICQRVENICVENNMVQNPGKYVNVVGEHFRKVIDTLVNDLCDQADDVLELFSELSFGHASLVMASGTKGEELDNCGLHEKVSTCACEETELTENLSLEHHTVPSVMENLGPGFRKDTSDEVFLTSRKLDRSLSTDDSLSDHGDDTMVHEEENVSVENYACDGPEDHSVKVLNLVQIPSEPHCLNKKDVSSGIIVEAPMFQTERLNSAMQFCDAASLDVNLTASISVTEENLPITHQSIHSVGPSPFNSIYILDIESEETSFLLESDGSELAPNKGPIEREKSMKYENLSNFSRDEFGNPSIFSLTNEDLGEFEDVILEDDFKALKVENDWDDIVKTEIALISSLAAKRQSSKMKLKKMFSSRWRPSRSRAPVITQDDLHSATSSYLDWELL